MNKTIIRCPLSAVRSKGITLMECLASVFVIGIGLLGVLAVIPYGSFQIGKARNSEHTAWMLAGAEQDLPTIGLAKPESWESPPKLTLDCTKIVLFDPFGKNETIGIIQKYASNLTAPRLKQLQEQMTGQDDLVYSTYPDRRPDFVGQNGYIRSSGKYTWFFTFRPLFTCSEPTHSHADTAVPLVDLNPAAIDLLGCYNRIPADDEQVPGTVVNTMKQGGTLNLTGFTGWDKFKDTKYVFVTWAGTPCPDGVWCKVLYVNKDTGQIIVMGKLSSAHTDVGVFVPSGVLYHKQISNVNIK